MKKLGWILWKLSSVWMKLLNDIAYNFNRNSIQVLKCDSNWIKLNLNSTKFNSNSSSFKLNSWHSIEEKKIANCCIMYRKYVCHFHKMWLWCWKRNNSKKTHLHNHQVLDDHTYGLYSIHLHQLQLSLLLELTKFGKIS
jgi:hypothetical protein